MSNFRGQADYKSAFSTAVDELIAANYANPIPRNEKSQIITDITDEYVVSTGERPDVEDLDRLANVFLHEELTDMDEHKMSREEYPIMSERQHERRVVREPLTNRPENLQQRGVYRRKRTVYEMIIVDRNVQIRNAERRRKYREFTKVQPVITYSIATGPDSRGI